MGYHEHFYVWPRTMKSRRITTATIDRLLHYSHVLFFDGETWRMRNSLIRR